MEECLHFQLQGSNRACNVWLFATDNLKLKDISLEPFDIIICDGPYGILEPHCEWDDYDLQTKDGRERFRQYYRALFDAALRHLRPTGSLFIFNYPEGAAIIKTLLDEEFSLHFRRWITWIYNNHFDFDRGTNFRCSHEAILYYTKQSDGFIFKAAGVPDVLSHPINKNEFNSFKDGAKPLQVIKHLLNATSSPGGRLLSLFAGSGTDILAAIESDMDAVGFEINTHNFGMLTTFATAKGK